MEASSSYGKFQTLQSKRMAESELRPRSPALDVNSSLLTTSTFPPRMTQLDHAPNRCHYQKCTLLLKNKTKKQTYLSDPDATSKGEVPEENGFQCHWHDHNILAAKGNLLKIEILACFGLYLISFSTQDASVCFLAWLLLLFANPGWFKAEITQDCTPWNESSLNYNNQMFPQMSWEAWPLPSLVAVADFCFLSEAQINTYIFRNRDKRYYSWAKYLNTQASVTLLSLRC